MGGGTRSGSAGGQSGIRRPWFDIINEFKDHEKEKAKPGKGENYNEHVDDPMKKEVNTKKSTEPTEEVHPLGDTISMIHYQGGHNRTNNEPPRNHILECQIQYPQTKPITDQNQPQPN